METQPDALGSACIKTESDTHADACQHNHAHPQEPRPASVAECQLNLLDHIESIHHQISSRMDVIERELDGTNTMPLSFGK